MAKILGIDLGTNSSGVVVRDTDEGKGLKDQIRYYSVDIFKSGVGRGKSGEFSFAAERTTNRASRHLNRSRRYRIWETLAVLIESGYCPLSVEELDQWRKYDRRKGLKRQYPVNAKAFEQWIRLDFNGDGIPDYTSPYQLRAELAIQQLDFSDKINKYKLGRALYHIAQRRGFKSSKGETCKGQENISSSKDNSIDYIQQLQKSEEDKSGSLTRYISEHQLKTVGCAFAKLEQEGVRVRASEFQAVRSQYKDEIKYIFEFQVALNTEENFLRSICSEKKSGGSIFYRRPLRSQKGTVGKCTLESSKPRCSVSRPEFEEFRAWCLINNIKFGPGCKQCLSIEQKQELFRERFCGLARSNFKFEDIRGWMEKMLRQKFSYSKHLNERTINYKDNTNVSGCPVTYRLKSLLGEDWQTKVIYTEKKRINKAHTEHRIQYNWEDIWHICITAGDDTEGLIEFSQTTLNFSDTDVKKIVGIWNVIQPGYAQLSLKAIRNINRFLRKGLIYNEAILLAKLPDILGDKWDLYMEEMLTDRIGDLIKKNSINRKILSVVNALIASYKSLPEEERFAYKDFEYQLGSSDWDEIKAFSIDMFGSNTWQLKGNDERDMIQKQVGFYYQQFFADRHRSYFCFPTMESELKRFLQDNFDYLTDRELSKLYHHSLVEFYKPAKEQMFEYNGSLLSMRLLESPSIGSMKNPMALRVLYSLRKQINKMLKAGIIDENTRVVVETARELNDANMRWAIEAYQKEREKENKEIARILSPYFQKENEIPGNDIDKARLLLEQHENPAGFGVFKKSVDKYKLWLEQGCQCLYTGKTINLVNLFSENETDFEHTIPRSISFDNSMANLTICDAFYNRHIKKNQYPAQLPNFDKDFVFNGRTYTAILPRLKVWQDKVERLKDNVIFWKGKVKRAQDKDSKDMAIRQRHLWQMELDYWQNKLERFMMTEVTAGFRNSQLVDTRIITKYAYHYLKSVFNKVDVQKGSVTSDFRKMLGVQSVNMKKDREKNSHHAIDAMILTLIPVAALRDKMLELYYLKEEKKRLGENIRQFEDLLYVERRRCGIGGNILEIVNTIEDNILINHRSTDQVLTPASKRVRVRGKIVPMTDEMGCVLYEKDDDGNLKLDGQGHKIPIAKQWQKGDSIRGKLHKDTFYGAITQAKCGEKGSFMRDLGGKVITDGNVIFVVRRELKYKKSAQETGFNSWDDLEKVIVNKYLISMMKSQFVEGTTFKEACEQGIYMLNQQGHRVNQIRHIRCKKSITYLKLKSQTYFSDKDYKNYYYVEVGDLYVMCEYESPDKKKSEFIIYSLFDIGENRKNGIEDIPEVIVGGKNKLQKYELSRIIKVGNLVLLYKDNPIELIDLDNKCISNRLYVVRGFENDGCRILLEKHICAKSDDKTRGKSIKNYSELPDRIRCGVKTMNFILEGKDFEIVNGKIEFNKELF